MISDEEFTKAIYTIDMGQNDLRYALDGSNTYEKIVTRLIPKFLEMVRNAIKVVRYWRMSLLGEKKNVTWIIILAKKRLIKFVCVSLVGIIPSWWQEILVIQYWALGLSAQISTRCLELYPGVRWSQMQIGL